MPCRPLDNETRCPRRQSSADDHQLLDIDPRLFSGVFGMEVSRWVVSEIHVDFDSEELTDLGHNQLYILGEHPNWTVPILTVDLLQ